PRRRLRRLAGLRPRRAAGRGLGLRPAQLGLRGRHLALEPSRRAVSRGLVAQPPRPHRRQAGGGGGAGRARAPPPHGRGAAHRDVAGGGGRLPDRRVLPGRAGDRTPRRPVRQRGPLRLPAPRRARRDRDRRAPRDRPRAAQREPAPALADAARAADRRPAPRRRHRGRADPRPRSLACPGGAPRRGRRAHVSAPTIRDRAAIVGIGQTAFGKSLGRSEYDLALEAILAACADAGLSPRDIDGTVRYDMETTDEENLLAALGNPALGWFASSAWGGGGAASVLVLAATAIAAGMASTVLVYRSRARGKQSAYGPGAHQGGRYWERLGSAPLTGLNKWHVPHG